VHLVAFDVGAELDAGDEDEAVVLRGGGARLGDALRAKTLMPREAARSMSWVGVSLPSDAVLWL
jgi:hypothetical protein